MENVNLTGHLLIAMPAMVDPHFARSVAFICEHNDNGALGIVINRATDMNMNALFDQINVSLEDPVIGNSPVYFGGPVQGDRGFVLHQPVGDWQSTISIRDGIGLTTSKDILEAVARGEGPSKILVSLGYAGWSAGQLEKELSANAWLTVAATDNIIFDLPADKKLTAAMGLLGVDFASLSEEAGHA